LTELSEQFIALIYRYACSACLEQSPFIEAHHPDIEDLGISGDGLASAAPQRFLGPGARVKRRKAQSNDREQRLLARAVVAR